MSTLIIRNCDIFTGDGLVTDCEIVISGDRIAEVRPEGRRRLLSRADVVDAGGRTVAPGYVDLQVNGGGDVLFNEKPTEGGLEEIVLAHRRLGTTSILPTFITGDPSRMVSAEGAVASAYSQDEAGVLGIHFEGPAISPHKLGVHDPSYSSKTFPEAAMRTGPYKKIVTLAPEVISDVHFQSIVAAGVKVAIGHTNATYEEATLAAKNGASLVTHLFNAMTPFTGREPGAIGAAVTDDRLFVDVIPDGHHVAFANLILAWRAKERGKCFFVTDAMPPVGGKGGGYRLGDLEVRVADGRCVTDDGVLAGSALDMATGVRNAVGRAGIPREEALKMASTYPADYLGVGDKVGRIKGGMYANLIVLDNECHIHRVMYRGEWQTA